MKNKRSFLRKLDESIHAFITTWKLGPKEEQNRHIDNLINMLGAFDPMTMFKQQAEKISAFEKFAAQVEAPFHKITEEWVKGKIEKILPPEIASLYIDDRQKVPGLNLNVNKFNDLDNNIYAYDLRLTYSNKPVGRAVLTTKFKEGKVDDIEINVKELELK